MRKRLVACMLGGWISLLPALAHGEERLKTYPTCDRTPTESEVTAAKGAFDAGEVSFSEADYERAITYWEDAYRRDCTAHKLLLNLATAYELAGRKGQAVVALQSFLERSPDTPQRKAIDKRIEALNRQLEQEQAQAKRARKSAAQTTQPTNSANLDLVPVTDEPRNGSSLTPILVASAGGALAIAGSIFWIKGAHDMSDFEDQCGSDRTCDDPSLVDDANQARNQAILGAVVACAGGAIAGGGLAWYFLQAEASESAQSQPPHAAAKRRHARLSPAFSANYAGISVQGLF